MAARSTVKAKGPSLADLITTDRILAISGRSYFKRGEDYFRSGAVFNLAQSGEKITAKVVGTHTYKVELRKSGKQLDYSCTCPLGRDDLFCKHCVATALAWIERNNAGTVASPDASPLQDIASYLGTMQKEELMKLILEQVKENDELRRTLMLAALARGRDEISPESLRGEITILTEPALYRRMYYGNYDDDYENNSLRNLDALGGITNAISRIIKKGSISLPIIDVIEYAIKRIDPLIPLSNHDDLVMDVADAFLRLHPKGCAAMKMGKAELAERVLDLELNTTRDLIYNYRQALGKEGMAHLLRLVKEKLMNEEFQQQISSTSGNRGAVKTQGGLRQIARALARETNDIEMLIALRKLDPPSPDRSNDLISLYMNNGRPEDAIREAEEGIRRFGFGRDSRLVDFLLKNYPSHGGAEKSLKLAHERFAALQDIASYRALRKLAEADGSWGQWRTRALETIRSAEIKSGADGDEYYERPIIDLLLADKDYQNAWQEALEGGCSRWQWLELAHKLEPTHPKDALAVYVAQIEEYSQRPNARAYEEIIKLLGRSRKLMERSEFEEYLGELHEQYGTRRKFIGMLDEHFPRGKQRSAR